jgi:hypothetical protein
MRVGLARVSDPLGAFTALRWGLYVYWTFPPN